MARGIYQLTRYTAVPVTVVGIEVQLVRRKVSQQIAQPLVRPAAQRQQGLGVETGALNIALQFGVRGVLRCVDVRQLDTVADTGHLDQQGVGILDLHAPRHHLLRRRGQRAGTDEQEHARHGFVHVMYL